MAEEKKEPRWSVTYTIHLDDKNGKTWGTLYYPSSAHKTKADVINVFALLAEDFAKSTVRGLDHYTLAFLPGGMGGLDENSDFGVFVGVKAFSFCVADSWENSSNE